MRPSCDATAGQSLYFKVRCYKFLSHSILSHLHRKIVYPSALYPVLKRFPSISLCTGHFLLNISWHACFHCPHDHLENQNFMPRKQLQISRVFPISFAFRFCLYATHSVFKSTLLFKACSLCWRFLFSRCCKLV